MHRLRCVLIIFILTTFTQTPRDMSFIPDVSVHYTIFKGFSICAETFENGVMHRKRQE